MNEKILQNWITLSSLCAIFAGAILTALGLFNLSWPQVLPWAIGSGPLTYIGFVVLSSSLVVMGSIWSRRSPLFVGAFFVFGISLLCGAIWPLIVALWFGIASLLVGKGALSAFGINAKENWLIGLLVGSGLYGTGVGLIAHLPVNYPGIYAVAMILPIILCWVKCANYWQTLFGLMQKNHFDSSYIWLDVGIVVIVLIHFVTALMPELGHDALAMHLFVPAQMASRHQWGFDADKYVWAVMPMLGDWIFTIGYMLAGETASRLINIGFILALGLLVHKLVLWAGGNSKGARWAALIFLSTPLTYTESSTLFIESVWATFIVAGTLTLLYSTASQDKFKSLILLVALFFGFAAATKAVTLTILPVMLLILIWHYKCWLREVSLSLWLKVVGIFLVFGLIPYITAWWITGNPVFPFFNGIFQSPYYPASNFDSSSIFGRGVTWDILYKITFDSGKYLEASVGASGFQWLLLLIPTSIILLFGKHRKGIALLLVGLLVVMLVFQSVSYFRYAFPAWAILAAAMGLAIGIVSDKFKPIEVVWTTVAILCISLNILFLSSGAPYRDFPLISIWSKLNRDTYLEGHLPIRNAVELLNNINRGRTPVAIFSAPLTAGIESDVLYPNWYNFRFQADINAANKVEEIAGVLLSRNVEYVVLDANWKGSPGKYDLIENASTLIAEYGQLNVRKVRADYRFKTELLKNPDFSAIDGWALAPGAIYDTNLKVMTVNVAASATQAISARPGQKYLATVVARCLKDLTQGRVQINWIDSKGQFIKADIKTFDCTSDWSETSMEVIAPPSASAGIIYMTGHTATQIQFKSNSLKQ